MKSVCRHRNAGVCSTSTTAAATRRSRRSCARRSAPARSTWLAHVGEDAQALVHARAAERRVRAAVGLVVRRLEDERDAERRRRSPSARRRRPSAAAATRRRTAPRSGTAGGRGRRRSRRASSVASRRDRRDRRDQLGDRVHGARRAPRCCCSSAACTKLTNSGWPRRGFDVNSGWNWQPKNHGWSGSSTISHEIAGDRALRPRADREPGGLDARQVMVVDLVAMAMPLGDRGRAVDPVRERAGHDLARLRAEAHRAAHVRALACASRSSRRGSAIR